MSSSTWVLSVAPNSVSSSASLVWPTRFSAFAKTRLSAVVQVSRG
jgi:hypothetical protein